MTDARSYDIIGARPAGKSGRRIHKKYGRAVQKVTSSFPQRQNGGGGMAFAEEPLF